MAVFYNENPTTADTILFDLVTVDSNGTAIDPYKVNTVVIYFIERGFTVENVYKYTKTVGEALYTEYFKEAVPVAIFGNEDTPAWIGTDLSSAFVTKLDTDDEGNPLTGTFRLEWVPTMAKEGDYLLCYRWTPLLAGDTISQNIAFYLYADTKNSTSIPSHFTRPDKYEILLDRYQPEMFSLMLAKSDMTPDILHRFNKSIAKGFSTIEDQTNQIVDLLDANVAKDSLLPYLSNFFGIRLASSDPVLWRKQIKRAIPLAKKKGTLEGLKEALANADITFKSFTKMWQIVSESTWQESFTAADSFTLNKVALLPVEDDNFEVYIRYNGDDEYTQLTNDYVSYDNGSGDTIVTWVGDNLSVDPISLSDGDIIKLVYKIKEPVNQVVENYIRTLPIADQRDEVDITLPHKNWNVRLVAEDDPMFDVLIPQRHPFTYPTVFGKIRTEFPYSENVYNMDEYNGSVRDSLNPCDLDKSFSDNCTSCISSKFILDVEIENMSSDRIAEVEDIVKDFVPFHAVVHTINYTGSKNEFVPPPIEEIEVLITKIHVDNFVATQFNFNRLIEEGTDDTNELKRNMLADTDATVHSGTGVNLAISLFSPGVQFPGLLGKTINLEILSGVDQGEYECEVNQKFLLDIVQGTPDTITWPLDTSGFPYTLSSQIYVGSVDIYQNEEFIFSDSEVEFVNYGAADDWKVVVTSGPYAGTYNVDKINSNNTINILSFPTLSTVGSLNYELRNAANQLRYTGTSGLVSSKQTGSVDFGINAFNAGIRSGYYIKYGSDQFKIIGVGDRVTIDSYTGGDVIGVANVKVYKRVIDNKTGFLQVRGMKLNGTVPTVDYSVENDSFRENYLILIGTKYYQIESIDGSDMILNGPMLDWGLSGTSVNYSIVHFTKTSPITTTGNQSYDPPLQFDRLDRRGNESIELITETQLPMQMRADMLNSINSEQQIDKVSQQEHIWLDIEYKE